MCVHNVKHHSYDIPIGSKFQLETRSDFLLDAYMSRSQKRHLVELFIFVKHRYFAYSQNNFTNRVSVGQSDTNFSFFFFCFRDVAAAMAHRPETAAGIYDVHGDYHASTRLRGQDMPPS